MRTPFGTSLRRDPGDARGLKARIDALILERLEEAIDAASLDLLVQIRRAGGRPLPVAESSADREEFLALVLAFLRRLDTAITSGLTEDQRGRLTSRPRGAIDDAARLIAIQVSLAKLMPDYWQRFEAVKDEFASEQKQAWATRPGVLRRLLGKRRSEAGQAAQKGPDARRRMSDD